MIWKVKKYFMLKIASCLDKTDLSFLFLPFIKYYVHFVIIVRESLVATRTRMNVKEERTNNVIGISGLLNFIFPTLQIFPSQTKLHLFEFINKTHNQQPYNKKHEKKNIESILVNMEKFYGSLTFVAGFNIFLIFNCFLRCM